MKPLLLLIAVCGLALSLSYPIVWLVTMLCDKFHGPYEEETYNEEAS